MTVTVTEIKPNMFPAVDLVDAGENGKEIEVALVIRIEGQPRRVGVKLDRQKARSPAET
jgi:hypothetical protein